MSTPQRTLPKFAFGAMLLAGAMFAQTPNTQPAPDNTRTNQRDRSESEATADQQGTSPADRALSQKIRKAIVSDKSLSSYAHNVKIIAQSGVITLKGPVRSDAEVKTIVAKATEIAGDKSQIVNQLAVTP